jgi:hypothetical protein
VARERCELHFDYYLRPNPQLAPSPAAEHGPSNVDLVNKALNPGASDPDVPLPHPELDRSASELPASLSGPQLFARQENGGGILGLKIPIAVK